MKNILNANLVRAEVLRLLRLPGIYIAVCATAAMNTLSLPQYGENYQSLDFQFAFVATVLLQVPMLVWGAIYGASAYESGTIARLVFIAGSKNRAVLTQLIAVTVAYAFAIVTTFVLSLLSTWILGASSHKPFDVGIIAWLVDVRILFAVFAFTLIGFFAGVMARSKAAASAGSLAVVLVPAVLFAISAPKLVQFTPLAVASSFVSGPEATRADGVSFWQASLALSVSLVLIVVAGWLRATSRKSKRE